MRWLVDGYNVIRRDPDLRSAEAQGLERARAALLRLVAVAVQRSGDRFTVVFDGAPRGGPAPVSGRIEVRFSRTWVVRPPTLSQDQRAEAVRRVKES